MPTLIRPIAEVSAGEASQIAVQAFNESEVLTALRNGSDNLELIAWHTAPQDFEVTRGADSGSHAGGRGPGRRPRAAGAKRGQRGADRQRQPAPDQLERAAGARLGRPRLRHRN